MRFTNYSIGQALIMLFLIFLCISCNSPEKQQIPTDELHLIMDPGNLPDHSKLSELIKEVRIVPLETSKDCLIGHVVRLFTGNENIALTSSEPSSLVFLFSKNGKLIRKIGKYGKGPGEYGDIRNITVLEDSARVYVASRQKIMEYDYSGSLLNETPLKKGLSGPKVLDMDRVAYTSYYNSEVKIVNMVNNDTLFYIDISPSTRSRMSHFNGNSHSGYYYTALGRDTIWRIDQDSMRPAIVCDFGSGHFSSDEYFGSLFSGDGYPPGKLSIGGSIFFGNGYYHFQLLREDSDDEYHYDHIAVQKNTGESWHLSQSPVSDDILFCTSSDFRTVSPNGEWISVVGAYELIEALPKIKANKDFNYPESLIDQIEKLSIDNNPVLVFYTLKAE